LVVEEQHLVVQMAEMAVRAGEEDIYKVLV
jgi:hypothetical protein